MSISKTQRWLDLIAFMVRHRFPVSVEQIMEGVPAYTPKWMSESEKDRESVAAGGRMSALTPPREEARNSRLAMASLVIGAISLLGALPIFGGAIAIHLGTIAKSEIDSVA